jgi:predicted MFS family arabinose efflux permease
MLSHRISLKLHLLFVGSRHTAGVETLSAASRARLAENFVLNVLHGGIARLSQQMGNPNLILPLFLTTLGVPTALIGWAAPLARAGAMLPQVAVAGYIRSFPTRKWLWVVSGLARALSFILMILVALFMSPVPAGIVILVLVALNGMAGSMGALTFIDVVAKTVPRGQRGALLALRAVVGGVLALGMGLLVINRLSAKTDIETFLLLLGTSSGLMLVASAIFASIDEEAGTSEPRRNPLKEAREGFILMRQVPDFRRFIIARCLLLGVELSVPFYALAVGEFTQQGTKTLGTLLVAVGIAEVMSNLLWGYMADRSGRRVMIIAAALSMLAGGMLLGFRLIPDTPLYLYALVFMVIGFAEQGVALGSETYLIDNASETERPLFMALSNTLVGLVSLVAGVLGLLAALFGLAALIGLFIPFSAIALAASWWLPEGWRTPETNHALSQQIP